jgi:aminopeptidase N
MFLKITRPLFLIALLTFSVLAQAPFVPAPLHSKRTYDVQNYLIRSTVDYTQKKLTGQTTVQLKPLADGFNSFELDAGGMAIESVALDQETGGPKPLEFKALGEKLIITLDRGYTAGTPLAVVVKYTITDSKKGVYFVDEMREKDGKLTHPRQVWTQGEAEENHFWFPCYDYPDDKATSEQFVTVPSGDTAVANGELIDTTENLDGTKTFHYKMSIPYSSYLTSFVAGDYARVEAKYGNIPLGYYVYRGAEDVGPAAFGKTPQMIAAFEKLTGVKFPYPKYDQAIVADFKFGGMENITATTMADTEIMAARMEIMRSYTDDLVSHELAHSWFGDMVTCKTWSQLWLNEGFATFMEAAFKESEGGRKAYLEKVRNDAGRFMGDNLSNPHPHALVNKNAKPDDDLFDVTTYQKGGTVLYMLRETVGDTAFWKAVNNYLNAHKFDNVETADLQSAMEDASGQDLDWFFNEWVYSTGFPDLRIKSSYDPRKKMVMLDIQQMQKPSADSVAAFTFPVEIQVLPARKGAPVSQTIKITQARQTFQIPVSFVPKKILFDKDEKIMLKTVKFTGTIPMDSAKFLAMPNL